jgi:hypothetical protein
MSTSTSTQTSPKTPVMTKPELLAAIKTQLPELAVKKANKGWDIVLESWDDETILKAMGRSSKLGGALWAIEWRLTPLVEMRAEQAVPAEPIADDVIAAEDAAEAALEDAAD